MINIASNPAFIYSIKNDANKIKIFNDALNNGNITYFDASLLSKLRNMYYAYLNALIFMYYDLTCTENIDYKAEIFSYVIAELDFKLVHGMTDSIRDNNFKVLNIPYLDFNSWYEVKDGLKIWVYDFLSMLKIEKDVYYQLENPDIRKIVSRESILFHPGREADAYNYFSNAFDFMIVKKVREMENNLKYHPFREILLPETGKYKEQINFDSIELDYCKRKQRKRS